MRKRLACACLGQGNDVLAMQILRLCLVFGLNYSGSSDFFALVPFPLLLRGLQHLGFCSIPDTPGGEEGSRSAHLHQIISTEPTRSGIAGSDEEFR